MALQPGFVDYTYELSRPPFLWDRHSPTKHFCVVVVHSVRKPKVEWRRMALSLWSSTEAVLEATPTAVMDLAIARHEHKV